MHGLLAISTSPVFNLFLHFPLSLFDKLATYISKEFLYDLSVTHITSVHCRVKKAFFCLTKGPSIYYINKRTGWIQKMELLTDIQ